MSELHTHARLATRLLRRFISAAALLIGAVAATGCTGVAPGIDPVSGFDAERYLGRWYEIARLDHSFERGLTAVTADYSRRDDGGIRVINRGIDSAGQLSEAEGRAYFVGEPDRGHLKVSFFGPFYGAYVVFELDPDYQYAFVTSYNRDYLWLLARTATVSEALLQRFTARARALGFASDQLIFPDHPAQ
jgi:apolipoprotein D and lipocalin family protein